MLQFEARVKMTVSHIESAPTFIDACTHLSVLFRDTYGQMISSVQIVGPARHRMIKWHCLRASAYTAPNSIRNVCVKT